MTDPRLSHQLRLEREYDPDAPASVIEVRAARSLASHQSSHDPAAALANARSRHIDDGVAAVIAKRYADRKEVLAAATKSAHDQIYASRKDDLDAEFARRTENKSLRFGIRSARELVPSAEVASAAIKEAMRARPDLYDTDDGKGDRSALRQRVIVEVHTARPWLFDAPPPSAAPVRSAPRVDPYRTAMRAVSEAISTGHRTAARGMTEATLAAQLAKTIPETEARTIAADAMALPIGKRIAAVSQRLASRGGAQ